MSTHCKKFSSLGRRNFESSLENIHGNISSAEFALVKLRPAVRSFLLAVSAGEAIHPELVRMQMAVFVKSAVLRAQVFLLPHKADGLRLQSSEIHIASPGVGKGLACAWGDKIMKKSKEMARAYLLSESMRILNGDRGDDAHNRGDDAHNGDLVENAEHVHPPDPLVHDGVGAGGQVVNRDLGQNVNGVIPLPQMQNAVHAAQDIERKDDQKAVHVDQLVLNDGDPKLLRNNRLTFKDLDGVRKLGDLPLPGLLQLPTGSCEAMLLRVSRNNGFGYVPINEYIRDRQTILDKGGNNGIFLNSHDGDMKALAYKTTVSVPEMPYLNMF